MASARFTQRLICCSCRRLFSSRAEFPKEATWSVLESLPKAEAVASEGITAETIKHLEVMSLLRDPTGEEPSAKDREEFVKVQVNSLSGSVRLARQLESVNTDGVEPMASLLERRPMHLREDSNIEETCAGDVMSNAKMTLGDYFMAPLSKKAAEVNALLMDQQSDKTKPK